MRGVGLVVTMATRTAGLAGLWAVALLLFFDVVVGIVVVCVVLVAPLVFVYE